MFIFTTKFNKKRAVIIVLLLAVLLCAIILVSGLAGRKDSTPAAALSAVAKNNGQRIKYLTALGWEVDETALEEQEVTIPRTFSDVYEEYNKLQISQGFDLSKYGGVDATRYTYRILNYPGDAGNVVADMIVYRGEIIAGDVQSGETSGFMGPLSYPGGAK